MLELKMTQMVLTEVLEGPDIAVNGAGSLLATFTTLFDHSRPDTAKSSATAMPPPTANGVSKSIRGSVFGRNKSVRESAVSTTTLGRRSNETTRTPAIAVTDDDFRPPPTSHSNISISRSTSKRLQKQPSRKSIRNSTRIVPNPNIESADTNVTTKNINASAPATSAQHVPPSTIGPNTTNEVGLAVSSDMPHTSQTHDSSIYTEHETADTTHVYQAFPPKLSPPDDERFALSMLFKIWLIVASLYRRATLFDDAHGAVEEVFKQAKRIEALVAARDSSAHAFEEPGWAGMKSVEELWADAYSERGYLVLAQENPHEALDYFESALSHVPSHLAATVGLADILLDIYAQKITPRPDGGAVAHAQVMSPHDLAVRPSKPILASIPSAASRKQAGPAPTTSPTSVATSAISTTSPANLAIPTDGPTPAPTGRDTSPETLDRLAARDRAYALLSAVTKLGDGWDSSEAWFALARAYEESGQIEKAQECLWWVVELEEKRPVRHWRCVGGG